MLAPGGRFLMIHRPDALGAILAGIGGRLGALALLPVHRRSARARIVCLFQASRARKPPCASRQGSPCTGPMAG